jgi:hypothetical protein
MNSLASYEYRSDTHPVDRVAELEALLKSFRDDVLFRIGSASPYRSVAAAYQERIDAALAKKEKLTMICPRCKVDRFKEPCPNAIDCPMVATAQRKKP